MIQIEYISNMNFNKTKWKEYLKKKVDCIISCLYKNITFNKSN